MTCLLEALGQERALRTIVLPGINYCLFDTFSGSMAPPAVVAAWLGNEGEDMGTLEGIIARISVLER